MKILKPKKSKFDEDLASRINEEVEIVGTLVYFCGVMLDKRELEALREVYTILGVKPEDDYGSDNGRICIEEGHLCNVILSAEGLSSLPESIGNWTNLESININHNKLSSLPESIGNWKNLEMIYLQNNQLSSLPESVGNWINLEEIHLDNNQLSSLPESVGNWKNLQQIYLVNNPIAENEEYLTELRRKLPHAEIK